MKRIVISITAFLLLGSYRVTNVTAQETTNTSANTNVNVIETTTVHKTEGLSSDRGRYEEIIEESGSIMPGAPGSLDEDTTAPLSTESVTPAPLNTTTAPIASETTLVELTTFWEEVVLTTDNSETISDVTTQTLVPESTVTRFYTEITQVANTKESTKSNQKLKKFLIDRFNYFRRNNVWVTYITLVPGNHLKHYEVAIYPMWLKLIDAIISI